MADASSAAAAGLLFFLHDVRGWSTLQCLLWAGVLYGAVELVSWLVSVLPEAMKLGMLPPGGKPLHDRETVDYVYIWVNKSINLMFMYHYCNYVYYNKPWGVDELTLVNTVPAIPLLFLAYDLQYGLFHRFLHIPRVMGFPMYGLIHKHHHRQVACVRGHDDAVNTHPFEYITGQYMHLSALAVVPCHAFAGAAFMIIAGILASINHTRFDFTIGSLFAVKEHDAHHRWPRCNFGQYTMAWDHLLGTYRAWKVPSDEMIRRHKGGDRPAPILPDMCSPKQCASERARVAANPDAPAVCVVTGGNGLVGKRLVSMLLERGASKVVSIDLKPPAPADTVRGVKYVQADICDQEVLVQAFQGATCVFHVAALVGPYFPHEAYEKVNYHGTLNVISACRAAGVGKLVMTSSPTAHMDGACEGKGEDELPTIPQKHYLQEYARTKAMGEKACTDACDESLLTCAIAPHQVYGEQDKLFLPSFIAAAESGLLRVMGGGNNMLSFTHIDNVCHAHILAAARLQKPGQAPAGRFYVVTDGGAQYIWDAIDKAVVTAGYPSLFDKFHLSTALLYPLCYLLAGITAITGKKFKLNMFSVQMMVIHRYFSIEKLCEEVGYRPLQSFEEAWPRAIQGAIRTHKQRKDQANAKLKTRKAQ